MRPGPAAHGAHDDVRHRNEELLRFMKTVAKAYPRKQLHVVVDNDATHKHPNVTAWLAKNTGIHLHFTPTSVKDPITAIRRFSDGWNDRCQPFT